MTMALNYGVLKKLYRQSLSGLSGRFWACQKPHRFACTPPLSALSRAMVRTTSAPA